MVLVDGFGLLYRSYFGSPRLVNKAGQPVHALNAFCRTLLRLRRRFESPEPDGPTGPAASHFAVVLDTGTPSFRAGLYPQYKGHRRETPDELRSQLALTDQLLRVTGTAALRSPGWEADDLIASYATVAERAGADVTVVGTDKDLYQLICPRVRVFDPYKKGPDGLKGCPVTEAQVLAAFGVPPEQVVEVQALAGDACDAVPGVKGVGVKTAAKLVVKFGSMEKALEAALDDQQPMSPKLRRSLQEEADVARICRKLVQLSRDCPLEVPIEALAVERRPLRWKEETISWLREHGLYGIVNAKQSYF